MMKPSYSANKALRGLAVVEFAMVLPILMVILFGVVDFGRTVLVRQVMINLSREGANLASRGTALPDAINAVVMSSSPLNMNQNGYVVLTEVARDINGDLRITKQNVAGGQARASRIGQGVGNAATLPPTATVIPLNGQTMFIAEVFYQSPPITPLGNLVNVTLGDTFYDAAFF